METNFLKYQHVEKFGTTEVEGIESGECFVFPKLDGSNASLWWTIDEHGTGKINAGSRRRVLSLDSDNAGFYNWVINQPQAERFAKFFRDYPKWRLFGEWLVPHTFKGYRDDAWNKFYIFDVINEEGRYVHYNEYKEILDKYELTYIPPICSVKNPTYERLLHQLTNNNYLIPDGGEPGEGVVIKNYNYVNKYGRITWAKMVRNEFKEKHWSHQTTEVKERKLVEEEIVNKYVTEALVEKEYAKIVNEEDGWRSKNIPRLLNTIYYCLVKEEAWNFVKEFKRPTVDFKRLYHFTVSKVKTIKPNLF